jgi:hypothetical protein
MIERVCNLQLLLGVASAVPHGSVFRGTHDQILFSQVSDFSHLEDQVPVFTSQGNRVAQLYPWTLGLSNSSTYFYILY